MPVRDLTVYREQVQTPVSVRNMQITRARLEAAMGHLCASSGKLIGNLGRCILAGADHS